MAPLKILTWMWHQTPPRVDYDADKVNRWAAQLRPHLTIEHTLACVTDLPEGIDPDIEIIPPPREFEDVRIKRWAVGSGMPQCYRRLSMYGPNAAELFGAERIACLDIDMIAIDNLDPLFEHDDDFRMFSGTSAVRPYNGSMMMIRCGARTQVYEQFAADPIGVATRAREMYIGSDQAVVSMILGAGERTWAQRDGVYAWSPRLERQLRPHRPNEQRVPTGMRMMFFPGFTNPWEAEKFGRGLEWVFDAWQFGKSPASSASHVALANRQRRRRLCMWAYDDPKQWGRAFQRAARDLPYQRCRLFIRADRPPADGRVFVRLDQQGRQRDVSREMCIALADRGCITLPSRADALLYDDKRAQEPALRAWLPPTLVLEDPARARTIAQAARGGLGGLAYPFVSKAAEGAASANVRLVATPAEAEAEIEAVFGRTGLPLTYGRRQRGYLYWQRLIPRQADDVRICVVGEHWYGLVRGVRPGGFTASGSGDIRIIETIDERIEQAAGLALEISAHLKTQWMAYDFVFENGRPYVLECSSAWTMSAYRNCPMFDRAMRRTDKRGADSFRIAVELLRGMEK